MHYEDNSKLTPKALQRNTMILTEYVKILNISEKKIVCYKRREAYGMLKAMNKKLCALPEQLKVNFY